MNKIFNAIIILGLVVIGLDVYSDRSVPKKVGSVVQSGECTATSTYTKLGVPTFSDVQTLISNRSGVLCAVNITGAVAGAIKLMDATSTTDIASTTIAVIPSSAAAQTFNYDVNVFRGLIVETTAGLVPTSTLSFRQY